MKEKKPGKIERVAAQKIKGTSRVPVKQNTKQSKGIENRKYIARTSSSIDKNQKQVVLN